MILVPNSVIEFTTGSLLAGARTDLATASAKRGFNPDSKVFIPSADVSDEVLADLAQAAAGSGNIKFSGAIAEIQSARAGVFRAVKSVVAAPEVLIAWLNVNCPDGWVFREAVPGYPQPMAVRDVQYNAYDDLVLVVEEFNGDDQGREFPVIRMVLPTKTGRPETILDKGGFRPSTPDLRSEYFKRLRHLASVLRIGNRVDIDGDVYTRESSNYHPDIKTFSSKITVPAIADAEVPVGMTELLRSEDAGENVVVSGTVGTGMQVPTVPYSIFTKVYDLGRRRFVWAHADSIRQHKFRKDALEGIVLEPLFRSLLDLVLIAEGGELSDHDLIDGKTPGNLILCKGEPGIGKTLTAEAYAEAMEVALLQVDLSALVESNSFEGALGDQLDQARRWNAVLLLDEADVIVAKRGNDIKRNSITAAVLRVVERYERAIFLTTNHPNDIDDAVISRCIAILHYAVPAGEDSKQAWRALAKTYGADIDQGIIDHIVDSFEPLPPREVGQAIRLSKRRAAREGRSVSADDLEVAIAMRGAVRKKKAVG